MPKPTVTLDAGNDERGPNPPTLIGVSGSDFPPGSAVNISVSAGSRRLGGPANVRADGSFDWSATIRPKLGCDTHVDAVVHGADGIEVTAEAKVFCP